MSPARGSRRSPRRARPVEAVAPSRGRFITFEGGEGAGKSTQVELLVATLERAGIRARATREPGGSPAAEEIRELLVHGEAGRWQRLSEALLHYAARAEHLATVIRPALARGEWVVSDRFADSTVAYQGYGHQLGRKPIEALHRLVVGDFAPDLTLILDLPVELGLTRAARRPAAATRYERMGREFHQRLRRGFLDIARREPRRCIIVDASGDIETTARKVRAAVDARLGLKLSR